MSLHRLLPPPPTRILFLFQSTYPLIFPLISNLLHAFLFLSALIFFPLINFCFPPSRPPSLLFFATHTHTDGDTHLCADSTHSLPFAHYPHLPQLLDLSFLQKPPSPGSPLCMCDSTRLPRPAVAPVRPRTLLTPSISVSPLPLPAPLIHLCCSLIHILRASSSPLLFLRRVTATELLLDPPPLPPAPPSACREMHQWLS